MGKKEIADNKIIKGNFVFSLLSEDEIDFLFSHSTFENKEIGEPIVAQGEITHCFYIIVEGVAEVKIKTENEIQLRATLQAGDSIGLIKFEDKKKPRIATATVAPVTPMRLLKIDDDTIEELAKINARFQEKIAQHSREILIANLIKRALPFTPISSEKIWQCVSKVKTLRVATNEIIIREGETGDCCYLISEGRVEVFFTQEDQTPRKLAELHAEDVFGETAVLTNEPRNASVRALESCELFVLHREDLLNLLHTEESSATSIQSLIYHRTRPRRIEEIEMKQRTTTEGEQLTILKNKKNHKYFQLSEQGLFIWLLLDGTNTINDVNTQFIKQFQMFSPWLIDSIIESLVATGFVTLAHWETEENKKKSQQTTTTQRMRNLMEARYTFHHIDPLFSYLYKTVGFIFFKKTTHWIMGLIIIFGIILFTFSTTQSISIIKNTPHNYWFLIALIPLQFLSLLLHEIGHAITTKAYGRNVNGAGFGWYWFGPFFFVDTSDMWLATPQQRIAVNAAGTVSDLTISGVVMLISLFLPASPVTACLWLYAGLNYFSVIRNIDPLFEMDGYYILMDLFDRPHLRNSAVLWLIERQPLRGHAIEIAYWLICFIVLIVSVALTILLQNYVLTPLFPGIFSQHTFTKWVLPLFVVALFLLSVWLEAKQNLRKK